MKIKFDYYKMFKKNDWSFNPLFVWYINTKGMRFLTIQVFGFVISFDFEE